MRYYDGELSEEEAAELERTLDGQSARVVAGLDQLGSVLRAVSERRSEAAGDIAGSVLERIAADEAQPAPAAVAIRPAARWVAPAAVAALALAASVALYLGSGQEPPSPVARRPRWRSKRSTSARTMEHSSWCRRGPRPRPRPSSG
jgi:hypothetical protein